MYFYLDLLNWAGWEHTVMTMFRSTLIVNMIEQCKNVLNQQYRNKGVLCDNVFLLKY